MKAYSFRAAALLCILLFPLRATGEGQDFNRQPREYDVLHYKIELAVDIERRSIAGAVEIRMTSLGKPLETVALDCIGLKIDSAFVVGGGSVVYRADSAKLVLSLPKPLAPSDTIILRIAYRGSPTSGLFFVQPNESYPGDPFHFYTQGQPEDTRHWLPCYDYPDDKATSEVILTVPNSILTVSNGRLMKRTLRPDGLANWHWVQDRPHSSYLIMVAGGRYHSVETLHGRIPIASYYYPGGDSAYAWESVNELVKMTALFEDFIGVPYPWTKYVQIPVARYGHGGMENTTATVLSDTRFPLEPRARLDHSPEPLVAHELAHQWWGDLTTCSSWRHFWVNEGFATYFQQLWTEHRYGRDEFDYQRFLGVQNIIDYNDKAEALPVVVDQENSTHNTYTKGAAVLHLLRSMTGDKVFRKFCKTLAERYAYANLGSDEVRKTAEEVSGVSLKEFFDQWLLAPGYPDIIVSDAWNKEKRSLEMQIEQRQGKSGWPRWYRLELPVRIVIGRRSIDTAIMLGDGMTTLSLPLPQKPDCVIADPFFSIPAKISRQSSRSELLWMLERGPSIACRIRAAYQLISDLNDAKVRSALFRAAEKDGFWGLRFQIATLLSRIRPDTVSYGKDLTEAFVRLTRDRKSSIRSTALNGLNQFRDSSLKPLFQRMLNDSSYYVEAGAMNCLLNVDSLNASPLVEKQLKKSSYQDVVAMAALYWVERYKLRNLAPAVLALTQPGKSERLRFTAWQTLFRAMLNHGLYVEPLTRQLQEPEPRLRMMAASFLGAIPGEEARAALQERFSVEKNEEVRRFLEKIESARRTKRGR